MPPEKDEIFRAKGRDAMTGLPRYVDVTSTEIMKVIITVAAEIVTAIKDVLEANNQIDAHNNGNIEHMSRAGTDKRAAISGT